MQKEKNERTIKYFESKMQLLVLKKSVIKCKCQKKNYSPKFKIKDKKFQSIKQKLRQKNNLHFSMYYRKK